MTRSALHEAAEDLRDETREMHRAIVSLIEELEAIDWYAQRVDATNDASLREVLAHSLEEEKEHACMTLEWIRRNDRGFDALLRRLLFLGASESIVHAEGDEGDASTRGDPASVSAGAATARDDRGLGIGSLRARAAGGGPNDAKGGEKEGSE